MDNKQRAIVDELEAIIKELDKIIEFLTAKPEERLANILWEQYKKQEQEIIELQRQLAVMTGNNGQSSGSENN